MDRPFVVCHMLSSLDGKIDGEFFSVPECRPALAEYGNRRGQTGATQPFPFLKNQISFRAAGRLDLRQRK